MKVNLFETIEQAIVLRKKKREWSTQCKPCKLYFKTSHDYEAHVMERHFQFNKSRSERP
jgi:uncharacterized C2H2 Zn-finger protein